MKVEAYQALDGSLFLSEAECLAHNLKDPKKAVSGRSEEEVQSAMDRTDVALANAFEAIGKIITKKRLASGERRRASKSAAEATQQRTSPMEQAA